MARPIVTVFGGSGFVGRHLIKRLVAKDFNIRAAIRDIEAGKFLRQMGDVGQVIPWPTDISNMASVAAAVSRSTFVINAVGILWETRKQTFENVHVVGAANIAQACDLFGVKNLIHVSALGAHTDSRSRYARTKAKGEAVALDRFQNTTIMKPSLIFGQEDDFFNLFASISRFSVAMPIIGAPMIPGIKLGGKNGIEVDLYGNGGPKFQPVYVGDVADAITSALSRINTTGKTYELTGPTIYSFKEIMELILNITKRKRLLVPVCFTAAKLLAIFTGLLPKPILTRDQVELLRYDNIATGNNPGLAELGVHAHTAEAILPAYLHRFRPPKYQGLISN